MGLLEIFDQPTFEEAELGDLDEMIYFRYVNPIKEYRREGNEFCREIVEKTFLEFGKDSLVSKDVEFLVGYLGSVSNPDMVIVGLFVDRITHIKRGEYDVARDIYREIKHICQSEVYKD